jgi:BirA family biotin operon repressor/biotin-[acetyl-CoA-carboxylase] ligase
MSNDSPDSDDISAEKISVILTTHRVGRTVYYWPSIGSTNDELKRLAEAGVPEGTLAIADDQTAGRGRMDRQWVAPACSSLLMSLLFRPTALDAAHAQQLTMICSLAAADAVTKVTGLRPALKWPNDLLLNGRKLAGVLTELGFDVCHSERTEESQPSGTETLRFAQSDTQRLAWTVVGIGLNVNVDFSGWPELADTAISLSAILGRPVSRLALLKHLLAGVEARYEALLTGQSPHHEWSARLATLGQLVTASVPDGIYHGLAENVDEMGALCLCLADGRRVRILAGDVVLRQE